MQGRQVVTAPNGERWQVGRRWLNGSPPKPWSRRTRRERSDAEDGSSWLDVASFIDIGDDFLASIVVALLMAALLVVLTFAVLPLLGLAFEFALLIGVFTSGLFGRVVLRHPWTIEAVSLSDPQQRMCFAVKGWRRSRSAICALADAIARTGPPSVLPEATPIASPRGTGATKRFARCREPGVVQTMRPWCLRYGWKREGYPSAGSRVKLPPSSGVTV